MIAPASTALARIREGLTRIQYRPDLLVSDYEFTDFLSLDVTATRRVALAAFAQEPASYRTAGVAAVVVEEQVPEEIARYRAFGAQVVLAADRDGRAVQWWRMTATGAPEALGAPVAVEDTAATIEAQRDILGPAQMLRAKVIGVSAGPAQLSFFDLGLLPALDREVQRTLDALLARVLDEAKRVFHSTERRSLTPAEYRQLYRLVFRLIAGKMLADRQHPEYESHESADDVLREVAQILFPQGHHMQTPALPHRQVRMAVWSAIRSGMDLRHISAEALAYIYENTLVSRHTRKQLDIHATPSAIAEFVVRHLGFEQLPIEHHRVFEPFAGHAPFLIAAMGQIKALLPMQWSGSERHAYLRRMLVGMEADPFAAEVAQQSLVLADYPHGNGWQIAEADAFSSDEFRTHAANASIVLCNPPYGDFKPAEMRDDGRHPNKAVEAVRRILLRPPERLGLVLPLSFAYGNKFHAERRRIAEEYEDVTTVALPDDVFAHADQQVALVIARGRVTHPGEDGPRRRVSVGVEAKDYVQFLQREKPTWITRFSASVEPTGEPADLWRTPRYAIWERLAGLPVLDDVASPIARGLEYHKSWTDSRHTLTSARPKTGFRPGYANIGDHFEPYASVPDTHLSVADRDVKFGGRALDGGEKVIVNFGRRSRGPWPLTATIDRESCTYFQNFIGIWPRAGAGVSVELLAAVLNGPIANAFVAERESKRHIRIDTLKRIPVPVLSAQDHLTLRSLVRAFEEERRNAHRRGWDADSEEYEGGSTDSLLAQETPDWDERRGWRERLARRQQEIDALILRGYDLPPVLERRLLDTFVGAQRPGPVPFERFYPANYGPAISYASFISPERQRASVRAVLRHGPIVNDPGISAVMAEITNVAPEP